MKILYFGTAIFPTRISGDKNFIYELSRKLSEQKNEIIFISINDMTGNHVYTDNIHYYYLKRPLHINAFKRFSKFKANKLIGYRHKHNVVRENIEIFLTLLINYRKIKKIIKKYNVDILHILDNYGLNMFYFNLFTKKNIVISTIYRYQPKGLFYDFYLRIAYNKIENIIFTNYATKQIFFDKGITPQKTSVIPWTKADTGYGTADFIRKKNKISLIWSGFIQQISEPDFYYAINIAKKLNEFKDVFEFDFYFKPESYKKCYKKYELENINIKIGDEKFIEQLKKYDFYFCPISENNSRSTFAPPLTWIECWLYGIPIITTKFIGSEEIIKEGINGWAFNMSESIYRNIYNKIVGTNLLKFKNKCINYFKENYSIGIITKKYIDFYSEVLSEKTK